ncbi:MAG: hypothetical protein GY778_12110, partial [bacterium]|nr:hypothetical protein [bacterium]
MIEFPDGSQHVYSEVPGWAHNFELREMKDRFGNATTIDYTYGASGWLGDQTWTVTDPHGRVHYVHLVPQWNALPRVTSIDYQTVGGQRAVYQFVYRTEKRWRSKRDNYPYNNDLMWLDLLTKVIYPDGSELRMLNPNGTARYYDLIGNLYDLPGVIAGLELPTGGQLEWDFTDYLFMDADDPVHPAQGTGVAERRMIRADGTLESTVTYNQTWTALETWPAVATQTDIVYPGGHCSRHFFWQQPWLSTIGWLGWDHGLGYQKN